MDRVLEEGRQMFSAFFGCGGGESSNAPQHFYSQGKEAFYIR